MKKILKLFALGVMLAVPGMASAADQLPKGFIAMSESFMNWEQAKAWCKQRGGRQPLINGAASQTWEQIANQKTALIDGFGQINTGPDIPADWTTPWPPGLPGGKYWTGAEHSDYPGVPWYVSEDDGFVFVFGDIFQGDSARQNDSVRAVCVP